MLQHKKKERERATGTQVTVKGGNVLFHQMMSLEIGRINLEKQLEELVTAQLQGPNLVLDRVQENLAPSTRVLVLARVPVPGHGDLARAVVRDLDLVPDPEAGQVQGSQILVRDQERDQNRSPEVLRRNGLTPARDRAQGQGQDLGPPPLPNLVNRVHVLGPVVLQDHITRAPEAVVADRSNYIQTDTRVIH